MKAIQLIETGDVVLVDGAVVLVAEVECVGDLWEDGSEWYKLIGFTTAGDRVEAIEHALVKFELA